MKLRCDYCDHSRKNNKNINFSHYNNNGFGTKMMMMTSDNCYYK